VTCACGALTASGRPWRPRLHWSATSGGGWTELDDDTGSAGAPSPDDDASRRRIGY
jgi:hypothetical protein